MASCLKERGLDLRAPTAGESCFLLARRQELALREHAPVLWETKPKQSSGDIWYRTHGRSQINTVHTPSASWTSRNHSRITLLPWPHACVRKAPVGAPTP